MRASSNGVMTFAPPVIIVNNIFGVYLQLSTLLMEQANGATIRCLKFNNSNNVGPEAPVLVFLTMNTIT
ncbi:hypothetical protein NQ317_011018 [Molorchus minor]|uniref:Uncharacterized protein n=1 Tax=Molorchus minor TaxID=1323400 RepID=A0ABQ9IUJ5_9CUCU|nr:hypothetical protein NQ317_011018 [Molorchus minor]